MMLVNERVGQVSATVLIFPCAAAKMLDLFRMDNIVMKALKAFSHERSRLGLYF